MSGKTTAQGTCNNAFVYFHKVEEKLKSNISQCVPLYQVTDMDFKIQSSRFKYFKY